VTVAWTGASLTISSQSMVVRSLPHHRHCSRASWRTPTARDLMALTRRYTIFALTSILRVSVVRCMISCAPVKSANATMTDRTAPATGGTIGGVDQHCHGFHRRFPTRQWQICHPHHRRPVVKVCAFHPIGPPIHGDVGGADLLQQHRTSPLHPELHC
jgi:hypothetical protein